MSVTPLTFTGTSQYSSDFQSILNRAVSIASIPLTQLENQDETDLSKETQLGTLNDAVQSLQSAVANLGTVASSQALAANSSDPSSVTFTDTGATQPASYSINSITSIATAASESSTIGYADSTSTPVSSTGTLQLVVGSANYTINLTSGNNNLNGLENAINSLGAGVTASILTTGDGTTGDYLSISSNATGATTLQLFDDPTGANTNLLTSDNQGTDAVFQLNGITVTRSENTINDLIPGGTLTLQAPTSTPVTLTLASDPSQLDSAIQSFVSAYNSAVDQINSQTGQNAGLLSGDSIIWQLQADLRQLTTFQGSGSIQNLSDMGITLGSDGKMSFDEPTFDSLSDSQIAGAFQFFGSTTTAFGGLSQVIDQIGDPIDGAVATEQSTLQQDDARLQTQIETTVDNINDMQNTLFQQLSQADTLISTLNSQQSLLTASIQSMDYVLYGPNTSSTSA